MILRWLLAYLRAQLANNAGYLALVSEACATQGIGSRQFFAVLRHIEREL